MKLLSKLLLGAAVVTILACGGGGGTGADVKETRIAFWGRTGTTNALFITEKADTTVFRKIANITDATTFVRLSPNRQNVLWIEKNFLFAMRVDGTGKVAFGPGMKTANADWGADSDVILIEPLGINKISSTRMSDPKNSRILFNDVTEMNVSLDGTRMAFVPLGTRAVHYSNTDGTGLDSLAAEPAGSAVMEPAYSLDKSAISYIVQQGSASVTKVHDLTKKTTTVASGTVNILGSHAGVYQWGYPVAVASEAGATAFKYSLQILAGAKQRKLVEFTGTPINRPTADPVDSGEVLYTVGTGLYRIRLEEESSPSLLSVGLDAAGYSDWR